MFSIYLVKKNDTRKTFSLFVNNLVAKTQLALVTKVKDGRYWDVLFKESEH